MGVGGGVGVIVGIGSGVLVEVGFGVAVGVGVGEFSLVGVMDMTTRKGTSVAVGAVSVAVFVAINPGSTFPNACWRIWGLDE